MKILAVVVFGLNWVIPIPGKTFRTFHTSCGLTLGFEINKTAKLIFFCDIQLSKHKNSRTRDAEMYFALT